MQLAVGRSLKPREAALGRQHGIDQEAGAGVVDEQGGIANLGNLHGVLRSLVGGRSQYGAEGIRG